MSTKQVLAIAGAVALSIVVLCAGVWGFAAWTGHRQAGEIREKADKVFTSIRTVP